MNHFHTASPPALIRKSKQSRMNNEIDDFLSSDLELSFASTMSLNSPAPSRAPSPMAMDISPAPIQQSQGFLAPPSRHFGRNLLNSESISSMRSAQSKSKSKGLQRSALPTEWISPVATKDTSLEGFSIVRPSLLLFNLRPNAYFSLLSINHHLMPWTSTHPPVLQLGSTPNPARLLLPYLDFPTEITRTFSSTLHRLRVHLQLPKRGAPYPRNLTC